MENLQQNLSPKKVAKTLNELTESQPVVFAGAGISYASGLPLADEMKEVLLKELCIGTDSTTQLWTRKNEEWTSSLGVCRA